MINALYLHRDLRPNQLWCYQRSQSKFKSWTVSLSLSTKSLPHGPKPRGAIWSAVIRCNYQSMIEREAQLMQMKLSNSMIQLSSSASVTCGNPRNIGGSLWGCGRDGGGNRSHYWHLIVITFSCECTEAVLLTPGLTLFAHKCFFDAFL